MIQGMGTIDLQFLANLQLLTQETDTTQEQISSGKQINQPSDNPGELGDVLELESELSSVNQVSTNLAQVTSQVNTAQTALQSATTVLDNIVTLGEQGAGSSVSASVRTSLSEQVQEGLSELVSLANTQYDGQYVFSGDDATQPSYQVDLNSATGVDQLITTSATSVVQDATGVTFGVAQTAQQIFDDQDGNGNPAADNIFAAVNNLQIALANNDTTGIQNALTSLQAGQTHLSESLQYYGGVQDQLQNATTVASNYQLQYQTSISQLTDTNMATAAVTLTQEQTAMQAAMSAESDMPKTTLFDMISSNS